MALFGFGKKKEAAKRSACRCGASADGIRCIRVLGAGCRSCRELYENTKAAVQSMGLSVDVEYITDMQKIMSYGAMSMPAVVVNDRVASMGKVLKASEVEALLHRLGF